MSPVRALGIYKCPPHLSREVFIKKCEAIMDAVLASPVGQRHLVKYELLVPNESASEHLDTLGMPSHQGTVVMVAEWASHEGMVEASTDATLVKNLKAAQDEFGIHLDGTTFAVDVIVKK
ncbi:hypothetical protein FB45DRAFT_1055727 [Roridomyces roridus]|uniref:Uncharacterized protein n=1 Tax=Roridomyces roridus TaxID=1738132 RepID=A0AAD7FT56_9AGAR|nr:hypothetical protein FB45DRAFT_1055727 [Roridomyces roridus]